MGFEIENVQVTSLWNITRPTGFPTAHSASFIHLICWMLWKHRNDVVFNNMAPSYNRLRGACKDAVKPMEVLLAYC